jgi:hypothetical protein
MLKIKFLPLSLYLSHTNKPTTTTTTTTTTTRTGKL